MSENSRQSPDDITWWTDQFIPPNLLNTVTPPTPLNTHNTAHRPSFLPSAYPAQESPYHTFEQASDLRQPSLQRVSPTQPLGNALYSQQPYFSAGPPPNSGPSTRLLAPSQFFPSNPAFLQANPSQQAYSRGSSWTPSENPQTQMHTRQESSPSTSDGYKLACEGCSQTFYNPSDKTRHWKCSCPGNSNRIPFACPNCGQNFTRQDALNKHVKLVSAALGLFDLLKLLLIYVRLEPLQDWIAPLQCNRLLSHIPLSVALLNLSARFSFISILQYLPRTFPLLPLCVHNSIQCQYPSFESASTITPKISGDFVDYRPPLPLKSSDLSQGCLKNC